MSRIPNIIHQTWINEEIPLRLRPLIDSWKKHHPNWDYVLWTDEMNRKFIKESYPNFLEIYDSYKYEIQRVDAVRYFVLLKTGGVFIDLDFECIRNIEPILLSKTCVFGLEPNEHCIKHSKEKILCNAFMACEPDNEFMKEICQALLENNFDSQFKNLPPAIQVLESTGPFKLTSIYDNYPNKDYIDLVPANLLYPLYMDETLKIIVNDGVADDLIQRKINQAYAVHYFMGSWSYTGAWNTSVNKPGEA